MGTAARPTRAEAKQRTREAIVEAARRVFVRDGFHGATLERVADEAGFTKGAVYSSFDGKADLFLAVLEERAARRVERILETTAGARDPRAVLAAAGDDWAAVLADEQAWLLALIEFWVHAGREPRIARRFAAIQRRARELVAEALEAAAAREGHELPVRPAVLAMGIMALGNGLALEGVRAGDGTHVDTWREMLDLLADAIGGMS